MCPMTNRPLFLIAALMSVALASPAHAYVVYRAPASNEPLRWCTGSVGLHFSAVEPEEIPWQDASHNVHAAVDIWNAVTLCSIPRLSFEGRSEPERIGPFEPCDDNENVVLFVKETGAWSNKGFSSVAAAMTTLTFDDKTGVIVDADIELNDASFPFSAGDPVPPDKTDLLGTLVHEVGHVYGLDHSRDGDATMYYKAPAGEDKKRTLHQDDVDGVCWIYEYGCPDDIAPICPSGGVEPAPGNDAGAGSGTARDALSGPDAMATADTAVSADAPRPGILVGVGPSSDSSGCEAGGGTPSGAIMLTLLALAAFRRRYRPTAAAACPSVPCSGR